MPPPHPNDRLHKQEGRQRPFTIPDLLSDRLDALCDLVNREGNLRGTLYRQDLIAALIALAPETVEEIEKLVDDYVALIVRDALVGVAKSAEVIQLRPVKPGRRAL